MNDVAQGLMIGEGQRLLLGLRAGHKRAYPHCWDMFGGHFEVGETPEQALVREFQEELGTTVTRFRAMGTMPEPNPQVNGPKIYHLFLIEAWDGEPANVSDEHTDIDWFDAAQALALDRLTDPARHQIETWRGLSSSR
ncbi:NUDIX hydrolase [Microvirga alba]|uniref:NUDIX domain-containing protein n=1 Tax=Microvirga alba TaxID=2791025 RepID=A0A931BT69_9HYPH|nr:NUDIX domain-containing protein [Microvirga alba]MBF9234329.1 NUDIX domain-containing protein [Microvirga alba]